MHGARFCACGACALLAFRALSTLSGCECFVAPFSVACARRMRSSSLFSRASAGGADAAGLFAYAFRMCTNVQLIRCNRGRTNTEQRAPATTTGRLNESGGTATWAD
jgi:hypothetical protein